MARYSMFGVPPAASIALHRHALKLAPIVRPELLQSWVDYYVRMATGGQCVPALGKALGQWITHGRPDNA